MCPAEGLDVVVGVPVRVVDDDGVCRRQVDAQAASPVTFNTYSELTVSIFELNSQDPDPGILQNSDLARCWIRTISDYRYVAESGSNSDPYQDFV